MVPYQWAFDIPLSGIVGVERYGCHRVSDKLPNGLYGVLHTELSILGFSTEVITEGYLACF